MPVYGITRPEIGMAKKIKETLPLPSDDVLAARKALGLSQSEFWTPIGIKQSTGSRHEDGQRVRGLSAPVRFCVNVRYGSDEQAEAAFKRLRYGERSAGTKG